MAAMQGLASIALLPSGSVSGHFIDAATRQCYGLFGTEIPCERECSRAEDYRLVNLTVLDFKAKKEYDVIVEFRGEDAARFCNADDVHGWEEYVIEAQKKQGKDSKLEVSFECSTLKSDRDAEAHIRRYMPALANRGAVVNIGSMVIRGLESTPVKQEQEESKPVKEENERKRPAEGDSKSVMNSDHSDGGKGDSKSVMDSVRSDHHMAAEGAFNSARNSVHTDELMAKLLQEELQAEETQDNLDAGDTAMKGLLRDESARQVQGEPVNTEPDADEDRPFIL